MGILDSIVEWIATQIMNLLDLVTGSVLGALGCDMSTFLRYFPAAETLYDVFVAIAVGFILLNLVWQLCLRVYPLCSLSRSNNRYGFFIPFSRVCEYLHRKSGWQACGFRQEGKGPAELRALPYSFLQENMLSCSFFCLNSRQILHGQRLLANNLPPQQNACSLTCHARRTKLGPSQTGRPLC